MRYISRVLFFSCHLKMYLGLAFLGFLSKNFFITYFVDKRFMLVTTWMQVGWILVGYA